MSGDNQIDKPTTLHKASSPWIELEAKTLARSNAETLSKLSGQKNLSTWNKWVAADLSQEDWVIVHQSPETYQLPKKLEAFVPAELLNSWNEICTYIREIHNQAVGLRVTQAEVVLAGDDRLELSDRKLREWANEYIDLRIERTKHRRGNLLKQFRHIYDEIVPDLEKIAFKERSINRCFFSELTDYLPTVLFERTCRTLVDFRFNTKTIGAEYRLKSEEYAALYPLVDAYQWHHMSDLHELLSITGATLSEAHRRVSADETRNKLQALVQDIQEMRPFLRHNFRSENVLVELAPNLTASFHWAVNRGVAIILFAPAVPEMLIHLRNKTSAVSLNLTFDGLLSDYALPWIDTDSLIEDQQLMFAANLLIVESIHTKLFALYEKVNVQAISRRFLTRNSENSNTEEPNEEEFAAICQSIAEPIKSTNSEGVVAQGAIKAVRVQRLLTLLGEQLGCEVRQGKGSEIVIFRSGGHHFRLGHHKRNSYVTTAVIKNLLKHVGIRIDEWIRAIC